MATNKIKHLVVDTSAFIKGAALQDIAEEVMTVQEVIDEVTSKKQLRKLVVLPYNLRVKEVFTENIKFVTDFSKKTGDYTSLSATDIKVMALTYQMEKEKVGVDHLKMEPTTQKTIKVTGLGHSHVTNNRSEETEEAAEEKERASEEKEQVAEEKEQVAEEKGQVAEEKGQVSEEKKHDSSPLSLSSEHVSSVSKSLNLLDIKKDCETVEPGHLEEVHDEIQETQDYDGVEDCLVKTQDDDYESDETESEDDSGSDNGEWITPSNVQEKKKEMDYGDFEDKSVDVACITSDFAMQNVLKQIGLNVTAMDGRIIRQVRTFIFRCTTCFKTTSVMTKVFCPKCGHSTLKKVAVSIDEHGNQQIHINGRKPLTARGKRFSLPTPKGGQHFQYPVLTEDQHIHKRKATRLAQMKNNPLDPDYIAGFSPFTMRDVNSKSAVLGVRNDKQDMKQWLRKGANDVRKKRK